MPTPDPHLSSYPKKETVPVQSRLISKMIGPALRFWLRSQVEQVENLQVEITGGDRQILAGQIYRVAVSAEDVVYQGLHFSRIHLTGNNMRINLGQVIQGQPLRLLSPVPVEAELLLKSADLNASLQAPLLATALSEFLSLLQSGSRKTALAAVKPITVEKVVIDPGQLTFHTSSLSADGSTLPLAIQMGLQLASPRELQFVDPHYLFQNEAQRLPLKDLHGFTLDLGPEVAVRELRLESGQLVCWGQMNVLPTS